MSNYRPTERLLIAAYSGLGKSAGEVIDRQKAATDSLKLIKAKVWNVAYQQGRWDERTAQRMEKHPGHADRHGTPRDNPCQEETE